MKGLLVALALVAAPLAAAGACATFEQVTPKSPRHALAEAEIAFIGVVEVAGALHRNNVISDADLRGVIVKLAPISTGLNDAHTLLKAGEAVAAARTIAEYAEVLSALALDLSLRAERYAAPVPAPQPAPTPSHFKQPVI